MAAGGALQGLAKPPTYVQAPPLCALQELPHPPLPPLQTVCMPLLTTGECPASTVRCGTQGADGAANPVPALPSPAPGATNLLPSASPSPQSFRAPVDPPSTVQGGVQCQRCELATAGACQAPNGVCFGYLNAAARSCPSGTFSCANDATGDYLDNAGIATTVANSGRTQNAAAGNSIQCSTSSCVPGTSGPCAAPLSAAATAPMCMGYAGTTARCPAGSVPCAGTTMTAGGSGYDVTAAVTPSPAAQASPSALPRAPSSRAQRGHRYVQLGYVSNTAASASSRRGATRVWQPEAVNASLFTHLVWAYARPVLSPTAAGGLGREYGFSFYGAEEEITASEGNSAEGLVARWQRHVRVQNPSVRTLLGVGGFDAGMAMFSEALASAASREQFMLRMLGFVRRHGFDGVALDLMYPVLGVLGGGSADQENFALFVEEMRTVIDTEQRGAGVDKLILFVGVAPSPAIAGPAYGDSEDVGKLAKAADKLVLHSWDVRGPWEASTGSSTPLFDAGRQGLSLSDFTLHWVDTLKVSRAQILLGLSAYARTWALAPGAGALVSGTNTRVPAQGPAPAGPDTGVPGYMAHWEVKSLIRRGAAVFWDGTARSWIASDNAVYASFENEVSLRAKADYIREQRLGGYALWSADSDDWAAGNPLATALSLRISAPASNLFLVDVAVPGNGGLGVDGAPPVRRSLRAWAHGWLSLNPPPVADTQLAESRCLEPVLLASAVADELSLNPLSMSVEGVQGWRGDGDLNNGVECPKVYTLGVRFVADTGLPTLSGSNGGSDGLNLESTLLQRSVDAVGLWLPATPPGDGNPDSPPNSPAPIDGGSSRNGTGEIPSIFDGGLGDGGKGGSGAVAAPKDPPLDSLLAGPALQSGSASYAWFSQQAAGSAFAPFWWRNVALSGDSTASAAAWRALVAAGQAEGNPLFLNSGEFTVSNMREINDDVLTDETPFAASKAAANAPSKGGEGGGMSGGAIAAVVIVVLLVVVAAVALYVYRQQATQCLHGTAQAMTPRPRAGSVRTRAASSTGRTQGATASSARPASTISAPVPFGASVLSPGITATSPARARTHSRSGEKPRPVVATSPGPSMAGGNAIGASNARAEGTSPGGGPPRPAPRRAPRRVVAPPMAGSNAPPAVPPRS